MVASSIWDDEWTVVASREETRLPPRRPDLGDLTLEVTTSTELEEWLVFVRSGWTVAEATERIRDAQLVLLRDPSGELCGTCVLRSRQNNWWLLETLRAKRGVGNLVIRSAVRWLWEQTDGRFRIAFTWELGVIGAMWSLYGRGWWRAAREIHWGWVWTDLSDCGWCPRSETTPWRPRLSMPVVLSGSVWHAIVSDSGNRDGFGFVLDWSGDVPWRDVVKTGGWRRLWCHSSIVPRCSVGSWRWSGEVVVFGVLNSNVVPPVGLLVSAEI